MVKRQICLTPTCDRPVDYPGKGLCKRCYQRKWYQTEIQGRDEEVVRLELTIKAMAEDVVNKARQAFKKDQAEHFRYNNRVRIPRSDFVVEMIVKRQADHRDAAL